LEYTIISKCQDYTLINQYKILTEKNGPVQWK
jgi:hypothetical protein